MTLHPSLLPDDYLPHLDELNRIVMASGDPLEGNLFYHHQEPNPARHNIVDYFQTKRHNYALFCRQGKTLLEIGVNGGHSALLALANGVEYHGVDICYHPYTQLAADYLKDTFGDRFHFYAGDSIHMLPAIASERPYLRFDLLHIDGYHTLEHCQADTENAIAMALKNAWIIIDDTDLEHLRQYYDQQVQNGVILAATPDGWKDNPHHNIGRVA